MQLIQSFVDFVAEHQPQMVTFNGHSFDLPVLRYRAMIHGLSASGLHARPYFHRFTEDHVDLCDVLSSFTYSGKTKLDEISRVMGLPGKPDGIDGSQVQAYFEAGRIGDIANYCQSDVLSTYRIWLRYELFRGRLTQEEFEYSDALAQSHERQPTTRPSITTPVESLSQLPFANRQANGSM
jgi:3'-5' exonuclease